MSRLSVIILVLVAGFSAIAHGDQLSGLDPDSSEYNRLAFEKTLTLCTEVDDRQVQLNEEWGFMKLFAQGVYTGSLIWKPSVLSTSIETSNLVNSEGFKAALYHCFGDNMFKHRAFVVAVIANDAIGRGVGMALWLVPISRIAKLFKLGTLFPASVARAFAILQHIGTVSLGAYVAWKGYSLYHQSENRTQQFAENVDTTYDNAEDAAMSSVKVDCDVLQDLTDQYNRATDPAKKKDIATRRENLQKSMAPNACNSLVAVP